MGIGDWFRKRRAADDAKRPADDVAHVARETVQCPYVRVSVEASGLQLLPTVSKLGGVPYVPVGSTPPPKMICVAQLNLAEVPPIDALPRTGIVQFWIEDNDTLGLYDDHGRETQDKHRVVYHATHDAPQAPNVAPAGERGPLCFDDRYGRRLRFTPASEPIAPVDNYGDDTTGHKIGGSCSFTQDDPRTPDDPMWSLLQLDSDEHVFWGDTGIAHWFIREADLKACNFANVRYYWDCC